MLKIMGTSSCQDCGAAEPVCGECAEKKIAELEAEMKRRHSATTEDLRKMVAMQGRINELEAELEQLKEDFAHQVEMAEEADNEVERLNGIVVAQNDALGAAIERAEKAEAEVDSLRGLVCMHHNVTAMRELKWGQPCPVCVVHDDFDVTEEQPEQDLSKCPKCGGSADNGHDREYPPNPYVCTKCDPEPEEQPEPGQYIAELEARLKAAQDCVDRQAECHGLWFTAATAPEALLQHALRELHEVIEGKTKVECVNDVLRKELLTEQKGE